MSPIKAIIAVVNHCSAIHANKLLSHNTHVCLCIHTFQWCDLQHSEAVHLFSATCLNLIDRSAFVVLSALLLLVVWMHNS